MSKIHIVTDSTADLPESLIRAHGITVVPLNVHFGEEVFQDGVDIWAEEFYYKLQEGHVLPRTSQPSPGAFAKTYESLTRDGDSVISIHISSAMSGTAQSARMAREMLPDADITVIDSGIVHMGLGFAAIVAAEAAAAGATKEEIQVRVERACRQMQTFFVVDTLEFLQKNGRIGRASAFLGTLLNIKPVLTLEDGVVSPVEKVRGKSKAINRILELHHELLKGRAARFSVGHADRQDEAAELANRIRQEFATDDVVITDIGPVVGVHVGPGTFAIIASPRD